MAEENTNVSAPDSAGDTQNIETNTNSQEAQNESQTDIEKLIQRAVDRATNKLGNENKRLREQYNALKKEKLSNDEIKRLELADKEADIADREAKLTEKENRLFAIKAIKEAGLDDGSDMALELVDFVMSDNENATRAKVKAFSALVDKMVSAKVTETFKSNGRNPEKRGYNESSYNANHAVITSLGDMAAERQKMTNEVLNHYLGGK